MAFAVVRAVDCHCGEHLVASNDVALGALLAAHLDARHPAEERLILSTDAARLAWIARRAYWELAPAWNNLRRDE